MRFKALETIDRILSWTLADEHRSYLTRDPLRGEIFCQNNPQMQAFAEKYSYFSAERPLIATVTKNPEDVALSFQLLQAIDQEIQSPCLRQRATAEALAKVIAFRDLAVGTEIPIPSLTGKGKPVLIPYLVDEIFDLWKEIPAYGLVPKKKGCGAPILLFRGTDLSLTTKRSWASILSDFDIKGPGFSLFQKSRAHLREWFRKVGKTRLIGFSLGGTLAEYVAIYEAEWISCEASYAFNPPGVSKGVYQAWRALPCKPPLKIWITQGDLIPRVGRLFSDVFEFCPEMPPRPIEAHVMLVTAQPKYSTFPITLED